MCYLANPITSGVIAVGSETPGEKLLGASDGLLAEDRRF